ncbi:dermonecrotic toxin domain-containing protein [Pseudomonas putida]|uniref:RING-type E3 ubiquitin transferase n=1 Tax=Pseudomonas putida TaxID=303 RepID=A0A6I6XY52_PSEPU|nr:DUF6543 domain-containing protein [Pseudomonas putida]QHG64151.1 hypothetical protein C2H86_06875 [Pseudomonas putida]
MPRQLSPHLAFIQRRAPQWLTTSKPAERKQLELRVRESHRATRQLRRHLAGVQTPEAFCRPQLEDALAYWFAEQELPDVGQGWLWDIAQGRDRSWLEAAMLNFDEGDRVRLYLSKDAAARTDIDAGRFVNAVRNLDLGRRYQAHLADLLDTDLTRQMQQRQDKAAFAVETSLAKLHGHIDSRGQSLGEAALAGVSSLLRPDGNVQALECSYLTLLDCPLNGPLLIRMRPQASKEVCLLYLPGHPTKALRQYPSLAALGQALTQMLWHDEQRRFFLRYVSHEQQPLFAKRLREILFPRFPYATLQPVTPHLEKGEHFSWISRLFPNPRHLWQETLDKNARLPWSATPWSKDCFAERTRTMLERKRQDAAHFVVPTEQRDAAALRATVEGWLEAGLNALNVASFFVPGLAEVMLVVGGAQVVDEFLEGVHAANEGESDAAIGHLFAVFENLAQFAAIGAAGHFAEPTGPLHDWQRVGEGDSERLWHGSLSAFAQPRPWPAQTTLPANGLHTWQGTRWWLHEGQAYAVESAGKGRWRLAAGKYHRHQPRLLGNGDGAWLLEHERPLAWHSPALARRLGPASAGLDDTALMHALRSSGYDDAALRRLLQDHRPLPAPLLDSLEAFGATLPKNVGLGDSSVLARDFPSLSPRIRNEILATASSQDLAALKQSGRLPLRLAEQARLYLRDARLNRALRQLRQLQGSGADRDRLVFANLPRLPGWTGDIRLELHDNGRLIDVAGNGTTSKQVLRSDLGYEPADDSGQVLGNRDELLASVLQALPDSERNALKLDIHDVSGLRDALFDLAWQDREATARDLGMAPIRPLYNPPTWLDGKPGYRLSGRGRGWLSDDELFDQLYPAGNLEEREWLRQQLRQEAGDQPGAFARMLEGLRADYQRLDSELQGWVETARGQQRTARDVQAQRIRQAWRRENPVEPTGAVNFVIVEIDAAQIGALPTLSVPLPQVRQLRISGLVDHANTQLDGFLRAFPRLRNLDLEDNALRVVPAALGELTEMQLLDLSHNLLDLSREADVSTLTRLINLQRLNLSQSLQNLSVSALERLAELPSLSFFQADLNNLTFGAEHFQALQRWPSLTHLELGRNEIVLTEESRSALAGLNRLRLLSLRYNPLELAPDLTGWTALEQLDLERTLIFEWPTGLTALMGQEPMNLRAIDLSLNELSDVPALRDTTFARRVREGDDELSYAFDDNPLSDLALQRLDDAGLPIQQEDANANDWTSGWPGPLRAHVSNFWMDANWQPLFDLYQRMPGTQAYQTNAAAIDERMRHVLQTLIDGARTDQPGTGIAQLQQQINDLLNDAGQQCVDQASLLFQQVETEVTVWQSVVHAQPGASNEQVAIESVASLMRQRLLDEHIGELYNARRARRRALAEADNATDREAAPALSSHDDLSDALLTEPDFLLDELEMALFARIRLQQRLRLPAQPVTMQFEYLARLSDSTLLRLEQAVWAEAGAQDLNGWASDQPFWQRWLERLHPHDFEAFARQWEGASEYFDTLNDSTAEAGAYTGPEVPPGYIASLEQHMGHIAWRRAGVLQRVDLSNDSEHYLQASTLLLQSRRQAWEALLGRLTAIMSEANPRAFAPDA